LEIDKRFPLSPSHGDEKCSVTFQMSRRSPLGLHLEMA
jgi:hypothetical protein